MEPTLELMRLKIMRTSIFLVHYVLKIIGNRKVDKYLKANPGRNPLGIILSVDWANTITLVVNSSKNGIVLCL